MKRPDKLYRLEVFLSDPPDQGQLCLLLADLAPWGWEERESRSGLELSIHDHSPEHLERAKQRIEGGYPQARTRVYETRSRRWDRAWRKYFKPALVAERFLILPSWDEPLEAEARLVPVLIEPKMAFGTGQHPSTRLCLESLARLWEQKRLSAVGAFLDLGTGSGILGIASSLLGLRGIGLDIDPVAVDNAAENVALNRVGQRFSLAVGSLDCLNPRGRFGLILANLLAEPLLALAPDLAGRLSKEGYLVISGLLREQEAAVSDAYQKQGLKKVCVLRQSEWSALIWILP